MKHSSWGSSRISIRRAGLVRVGWLAVAIAGIPIGFGWTIRLLYATHIPVQWGRSLWWVIFGACLAIGASCVVMAFAGRGWVRVLAIVAYLFLMAPALIYLGVIEAGPPRLVFEMGLLFVLEPLCPVGRTRRRIADLDCGSLLTPALCARRKRL